MANLSPLGQFIERKKMIKVGQATLSFFDVGNNNVVHSALAEPVRVLLMDASASIAIGVRPVAGFRSGYTRVANFVAIVFVEVIVLAAWPIGQHFAGPRTRREGADNAVKRIIVVAILKTNMDHGRLVMAHSEWDVVRIMVLDVLETVVLRLGSFEYLLVFHVGVRNEK
ncbi:hypothetical protein BG000_009160 [Podila horticola]|nr:hypothetical protein BG000_009160 [Podila horticola]